MSVFLQACQDLIKYKIIAFINTGDRVMDGLLNAVCIALIACICNKKLLTNLYFRIYIQYVQYVQKNNLQLDPHNFKYFTNVLKEKCNVKYLTWLKHNDKGFHHRLSEYYIENMGWHAGSVNVSLYDICDVRYIRSYTSSEVFSKISKDPVPIYITSFGAIVGLCKDDRGLQIVYQGDAETLKEFVSKVNSYKSKTKCNSIPNNLECKCKCKCKGASDCVCVIRTHDRIICRCTQQCTCRCICGKSTIKIQLRIYSNDHKEVSSIYPDRNFYRFISKHKKYIMNSLTSMINTLNTSKSEFNGLCSYNLGFMLHGPPGTGKTALIKAVCNYTNRDAFIINMRSIKTVDDFRNIFKRFPVRSVVYIFEELDCIEGIISNRAGCDKKDNTTQRQSRKQLLDKQYLQLLSQKTTCIDVKELCDIKARLIQIEKSKKEIDDALTLDTLLTMLDGVNEHRGRIIIATTNHLDKIDPALVRPGRFDIKIKLGKFTRQETFNMLSLMFQDSKDKKFLDTFDIELLPNDIYTPVQILNQCQKYHILADVIKHLGTFSS